MWTLPGCVCPGAGVLVEKPLATTVADAEEIIAASVAADRPLLVGHVLRFDARYARLCQEVAAGTIGDPTTIFARRLTGSARRTGCVVAVRCRSSWACTTTTWCGGFPVAR